MLKIFASAALAVITATAAYSMDGTLVDGQIPGGVTGGATGYSDGYSEPLMRESREANGGRMFTVNVSRMTCDFVPAERVSEMTREEICEMYYSRKLFINKTFVPTKRVSEMTEEEVRNTYCSRRRFINEAYELLTTSANQTMVDAGIVDEREMSAIREANPLIDALNFFVIGDVMEWSEKPRSEMHNINCLFLLGETDKELKAESLALDARIKLITKHHSLPLEFTEPRE